MGPLDALLTLGIDPAQTRIQDAVMLLVIATCVSLVARRLHIPYTIGLVLTGLVLGVTPVLVDPHLSADVVLLLFLPPILFEGALVMDVGILRQNWREVSLLSLAVTLGSFVGMGGVTHAFMGWPWPVAMLVGAILCATDPVSVLALMREIGAPRRLSLLLESESCFNDGIGVVLFTVVATWVTGGTITPASAVGVFVREALGGFLLGAGLAWVACRLLRRSHDRLTDVMLTLALSYGTYVACTVVHVSGIMGVIAAGLVTGTEMPRLLEAPAREALREAWELLAFLANSLLFLFMGVALQHGIVWSSALAALAVFAAMMVLRLVLVMGLVGPFTTTSWRVVLTWGGVRGSIPLALALALPALGADAPTPESVRSLVFGVVLVSLLAQGLTMGPLMRYLGIQGAPPTGEAPVSH